MVRRLVVLAISVALGACANVAPAPISGILDPTSLPPELNGVWRSNGYGEIVAIADGGFELFNATPVLCIPFGEDDSTFLEFMDQFSLTPDGRSLTVRATAEPYPYQLERIAAVPAECASPPPNTPVGNFDAFVSFMGAHYGFFELYGVDWGREVATARAQLRPHMSDADLFALLTSMLRNIEDGHLSLAGEFNGTRHVFEANDGRTQRAIEQAEAARTLTPRDALRAWRLAYWEQDISQSILGGAGVMAGNDFIQYGIIGGDIGYIALYTVGGYASRQFDDPGGDLIVLDAAMEDALARFEAAGVRGVILDLSINLGGYDFISRAVAGRFASSDTLAYSKSPADAASPYSHEAFVHPAEGRRFTGQVYVLTSDVTVSGGETLTLALRSLPNVTHAGAATRGALSDVLAKTLPNGWVVTISNEAYRDHHGVLWEGRGITPELPLEVFAPDGDRAPHITVVRLLAERLRASE
ncbi:MAG: S41 family peptidase [Hyphomonadaceae bacterium]